MNPLPYTFKLRLLSLVMLAPLIILTACGSGGGSSPSMGTTSTAAASLVSNNAPSAGLFSHATISTIASTVPSNGDINPYGVAIVEQTVGHLKRGHILVSNFNSSANLQGTGTTIVEVSPGGAVDLFAQLDANKLPGPCPGGVGLTTALVVLRSGWVIVGSLPTSDGTAATAQAGCLIVFDSKGNAVETFSGAPINGPWDMTAFEDNSGAKLFVSNVLNGTVAANGQTVNEGTVIRIDLQISKGSMPSIKSIAAIGTGFPERTDPAALVIGPTGLGLSPVSGSGRDSDAAVAQNGEKPKPDSLLYVADSLNNRIAVIPDALDRTTSAGTGTTLTSGGNLNDPLGLAVDTFGNIYTVNGNDGFITVFDPKGEQIATKLLDDTGSPPGAGTLFGLAIASNGGVYFVDDGSNTLNFVH
ncbi:hypothetical protein F6V30_00300 [Oryzomonas sagensis]|uniref:NHL repeat-containing protein n=1 Tax=Oryzomonas sagensis TaxID=2603857 RepID=A0ABQ6TPU5_9BACT|nr:hypothetical protein [Oryzomonas sagensis]KAB0671068.1 hypothetical protein F6V30_00300 [Oryzomonas sagensis]